ncbi:GAF domain-containing protein [Halorarius litoreus]|uniref:GAF domain-containing protein n=1 Tax=Halorarius litoreus TaxID=2962676 RepID=UPI0020CFB357|nr:GAF domain-containing protein [Halorarius litoreus]
MTTHHDRTGEEPRAERLGLVTADEAFATAMEETLDRESRLVETLSTMETLHTRLEETCFDGLVLDHDGERVDAVTLTSAVRQVDAGVPVVVVASANAGRVASDVLAAGATTFVAREATAETGAVAARLETAPEAGRGVGANATDRAATYRSLVDDALVSGDVGLVVSDEEGRVRWVTDAVGTFFDVPASRLVGANRRTVVREQFAPAVTETSAFAGHLLDPGGDGLLVRSAGVEDARWLDCRSTTLLGGPVAGGQLDRFVDVTRFVRRDDGLRELQRLMVTDDSFAERLHEVLNLGSQRLDLPYGFVTAIDDGTQDVLDAVGDHELLQPGQSAPLLQTYCRRTLAADGLITLPDAVEAGWENDPAYETFGLGAYIGAPIRIAGDHYGTLCFASSEPREALADDEELFVEFAASWAGWELERYGTALD